MYCDKPPPNLTCPPVTLSNVTIHHLPQPPTSSRLSRRGTEHVQRLFNKVTASHGLQGFNVIGPIGEGTFSTVYLAQMIVWRRRLQPVAGGNGSAEPPLSFETDFSPTMQLVAVKHILPTSSPDRILTEMDCLRAAAGRSNVIPLLFSHRVDADIVLGMPYIHSPTSAFSNFVATCTLDDIINYIGQLLVALRHIHRLGIIHRDIKPANFLYDHSRRRYALVDFGLSMRTTKWATPFSDTALHVPNSPSAESVSSSRSPSTTASALSANTLPSQCKTPEKQGNNLSTADVYDKRGNVSRKSTRKLSASTSSIRPPSGQATSTVDIVKTNDNVSHRTVRRSPRKHNTQQSVASSVQSTFCVPKSLVPPPQHVDQPSGLASPVHILDGTVISPRVCQMGSPVGDRMHMIGSTGASYSPLGPPATPPSGPNVVVFPTERSSAWTAGPPNASLTSSCASVFSAASVGSGGGPSGPSSSSALKNRRYSFESVAVQSRRPAGGGGTAATAAATATTTNRDNGPQVSSLRRTESLRARSGGITLPTSVLVAQCQCSIRPQVCSACLQLPIQKAARAGTPGFRPPEVLLKVATQNTAIDIWAAGVILLSLLARTYPFFRAQDDSHALGELSSLFGVHRISQAAEIYGKRLMMYDSRTWSRGLSPLFTKRKLPGLPPDFARKQIDFNNPGGVPDVRIVRQADGCIDWTALTAILASRYPAKRVTGLDLDDCDRERSDLLVSLLSQLLTLLADERISADDALKLPLFSQLEVSEN